MRTLFPAFLLSLFISSAALAADITITPGSVLASSSAKKIRGIAGETLTAGQPVRIDPANSRFYMASRDLDAPNAAVVGIALNGASAGQRVVVCTSDPSFTLGGTVAAGTIVALSGGTMSPIADVASGEFVTVLGVGIGSNKINFSILQTGVPIP